MDSLVAFQRLHLDAPLASNSVQGSVTLEAIRRAVIVDDFFCAGEANYICPDSCCSEHVEYSGTSM